MRIYQLFIRFIWMFFVMFTALNCSEFVQPEPRLYPDNVSTDTSQSAEELITFRSGVSVQVVPGTQINTTLLAARDHYATSFTDPYGYLWTISTAYGLTDQDFAAVGSYLSDETELEQTFYYGKIRNWEISPDCVVYLAAGQEHFVMLRRNQDQGPCPLGAGYKTWLPEALPPQNNSGVKQAWLWAYGANHHPDNIVHGKFQDVAVYGNDPYGQTCGDFQLISNCMTYTGITFTGLKWDSSEFANRYLFTVYQHQPLWHGPAKGWYELAGTYGLKRLPNCGTVRPNVGDVLVSNGGSHGHAAVIRAVSDHQLKIIQQNWYESAADNERTLKLSSAGNRFCVEEFGDGYPIQGWLRH